MYHKIKTNMDVHELAKSYFDLQEKKKEKRRQIDFDYSKKLKSLEQEAINVEGKLRVLAFKSEIDAAESDFDQYTLELEEVKKELKPILIKVNANRFDKLETQIEGPIHLETYLNEDGKIVSNTYHKMTR